MEQTQTAGRPRKLLVFSGKPSRLESSGRSVRNPGLWFHYLYSKIWGNSPGGNGGASSFANPDHVSRPNVFFRSRFVWGRKHRRFYASYLIWIFALLVFSTTDCKDKRASLEKRYAEARLLFQQGYIEQPLPLAEAGLKESANYPDLNWKFRILTAEARYRNKGYDAALEVLAPDPPLDIAPEILWQRRIAQAMSLCKLGKSQETEERFDQAAALHAEPGALAYARGRCAEFHNELKNAENYLRLVAAQSSNPDPFLKAYTLATLGSIAFRSLRYDEALDLNKECLAILHSLHAPPLEELVLGNLGSVYVDLSDFNNALKNSEPAAKMAAQLNLKHDQQKWLMNIGTAQSIQGKSGMAEKSYNDALAIATELRDNDDIADCLHDLTMVKLGQHQLNEAA